MESTRSHLQIPFPIRDLEMEFGGVPEFLEFGMGGNREKGPDMKMENGKWKLEVSGDFW